MKFKYDFSESSKVFYYPPPLYYLVRVSQFLRPITSFIDRIETRLLFRYNNISIEKPIYITGLARAGTTITLEMLSKHPDVATHKYFHLLNIYFPVIWKFMIMKTSAFRTPKERIHLDGIKVNRDSPEAVEEIIWQQNFPKVLDENQSDILTNEDSFIDFETQYKNNLKKILLTQGKTRYIAKNNYNIARMEYLLKLFPGAKFLLLIRNPINQIASLIKQDIIFDKLVHFAPNIINLNRYMGHREFGPYKTCMNLDNNQIIENIRHQWTNNQKVEGWAHYWVSIYNYVKSKIESNPKLAKATLIVKYDDLVDYSSETIDKILEHCNLSQSKFASIKKYYISNLHRPDYYKPLFNEKEQEKIREITSKTAEWFGY